MGRRFLTFCLVATLLLGGVSPDAQGQAPAVEAAVIRQPLWHGPDDKLNLTVRIRNAGDAPLRGYIVTVLAHGRVLNRSELHASFEEAATFEASSFTALDAPRAEIQPGSAAKVSIDDPVSALQSLSVASEPGVYPLTISVFDRSGNLAASTTTQLLYYPSAPEFSLDMVPVVPIADIPHRGPAGLFDAARESSLAASLGPKGWLGGLVTNLTEATAGPVRTEPRRKKRRGRPTPRPQVRPLHVGIALMPRLVEELVDMSDGFRTTADERAGPTGPDAIAARSVVASLKDLVGRDWVQPILAPYSFPDLPTIAAEGGTLSEIAPQHIGEQLDEAESVLKGALGRAPTRSWIFTPGGRLDGASLDPLLLAGAGRHAFFSEDVLEPVSVVEGPGCPEATLSFTCPVRVTGVSEEPVTGYALDKDLQQRVADLTRADNKRAALQRFFAETAVIREEVPSRTDRIIAIALPGLWQPNPALSRTLVRGLQRAPWLRTLTPAEGLRAAPDRLRLYERRVKPAAPRLVNEPDAAYLAEIARADTVVDNFRGVQPPPETLQRLSRNMLVSESRLWWNDPQSLVRGELFARDAADEADRELGKISIGGADELSLTSRQAEVPIVIFNDASYEVSVSLHLTSNDLRLDETIPTTVKANGLRQLTVDVDAQTSGIFTLLARIETPSGAVIAEKPIQVRSTEFNEIALGITFGALAFLILFYVTRGLRNRATRASA